MPKHIIYRTLRWLPPHLLNRSAVMVATLIGAVIWVLMLIIACTAYLLISPVLLVLWLIYAIKGYDTRDHQRWR